MNIVAILKLAINDCKSKFAGSKLGFIWYFFSAVLTIGIYCFVYMIALEGTSDGDVPYSIWLICGIIPWFFFSEGLSGIVNIFRDYSFLVKKTMFDIEILPWVRCISATFLHLIFIIVTFISVSFYRIPFRVENFWIIYWVVAEFCFILALGRILAVLNVFSKDISFGINVVLQLGFWVTPIFWNIDNLPFFLQKIYSFNPVLIIINGYRYSFIGGESITEFSHIYLWSLCLAFYILGQIIIKKYKGIIADRI